MSKLFKSSFLVVILLFSAFLTACGTSDDSKKADTKTEKKAEAKTKMYTDALKRDVEIPTNPKKVVALWSVGEMLVIGMKPIGSSAQMLAFYPDDQKEGIENVGGNSIGGDYEKILALKPELILVPANTKEEDIEKFTKIAPTVATQFFGDSIESLKDIGVILNKEAEVDAWIKDYDNRVNEARDELKTLKITDEKAVVINVALKTMLLFRSPTFPTIFDALQFNLTDYQKSVEKGDFASQQISPEILAKFTDADRIFLVMADKDAEATYKKFEKSSVWKGLPAVKKKQVYIISNRISAANVSTMDWALDEVMSLLKGEK